MTLSARLTRGDELSRAFAAALPGSRAASAAEPYAAIVGVEHEFTVRDAAGQQVDFRALVHRLPLDGRRLDPTDANAYRCGWGGVITADGREAELATPPISVGAGFTSDLLASAASGLHALAAALPAGHTLRGYSTHISVAVPDRVVKRVARLYAERFAVALMLLMDGPDSPGILVRPRPGRLELCGEYVDGERLAAVAAFAVASVRLTCRAVAGDWRARRQLPARVGARIVPATIRQGWYVDRRAFGVDLYDLGRKAGLRRRVGRRVLAQHQLEASWTAARTQVDDLRIYERELVDRLVDGRMRLGLDVPPPAAAVSIEPANDVTPGLGAASLIAAHRRPAFKVRAAVGTWDFTVFAITGRRRRAFAAVPRTSVADFLERLDGGLLDTLLASYLERTPAADRVLRTNEQTRTAGLHDAIGDVRSLVPAEGMPAGGVPGDRPGKRQDNQSQQPTQPSSPTAPPGIAPASPGAGILGLSPAVLLAIVGALALLAVVAFVALGGPAILTGSSSATSTPSATQPVSTSTLPVAATSPPAATLLPTNTPTLAPTLVPVVVGDVCPLIDATTLAAAAGLQAATSVTGPPAPMPPPNSIVSGGAVLSCNVTDTTTFGVAVNAYAPAWECAAGSCHGYSTIADFNARLGTYAGTVEPVAGLGQAAAWITGPGVGLGRVEAYGGAAPNLIVGADAYGLSMTAEEWKPIAIELVRQMLAGTAQSPGPSSSPPVDVDALRQVAEGLVPPGSDITTSRQGLPSVGDPDGWDDTLPEWTVYARGDTKFLSAQTFWDNALATLGATVDSRKPTAPLILDYDFSNPSGSILATFTELADGSTDADIEIHANGASASATTSPLGGGSGCSGQSPDWNNGTASVRLTGEGKGSVDLHLVSASGCQGLENGPLYPELAWADDSALNVFGIVLNNYFDTGTLSSAAGQVGIGLGLDRANIGGFTDFYSTHVGIPSPPGEGGSCTVTITPTASGGITGTASCTGMNDPSLPVGLEATFSAGP